MREKVVFIVEEVKNGNLLHINALMAGECRDHVLLALANLCIKKLGKTQGVEGALQQLGNTFK